MEIILLSLKDPLMGFLSFREETHPHPSHAVPSRPVSFFPIPVREEMLAEKNTHKHMKTLTLTYGQRKGKKIPRGRELQERITQRDNKG